MIARKGFSYNALYAFVVPEEEYAGVAPGTILEEVHFNRNLLKDPEMMDRLLIVESLPYLSSGKVDYCALENQVEEAEKSQISSR